MPQRTKAERETAEKALFQKAMDGITRQREHDALMSGLARAEPDEIIAYLSEVAERRQAEWQSLSANPLPRFMLGMNDRERRRWERWDKRAKPAERQRGYAVIASQMYALDSGTDDEDRARLKRVLLRKGYTGPIP